MEHKKQYDDHMKSPRYEDPSAKIWTAYLSEADRYDDALAHKWKSDMDAILIFAGLFSASVTAFLIESYQYLAPAADDEMVKLLTQISAQIGGLGMDGNSTVMPPLITLDASNGPFQAAPSALICSILWHLSLAFSLLCALFATLVQQWTRNYRQATQMETIARRRARMSAFLFQGLARFKMPVVVDTIPLLLHLSLFLFFGGLVAYLYLFNQGVSFAILGILVLCVSAYGVITVLPIIYLDCPYRTPLTILSWRLARHFRLGAGNSSGSSTSSLVSKISTFGEARATAATEISDARDERDFHAMCWALGSLSDDSQLEAFIEVLPRVVACTDYSAKLLLDRLLQHDDVTVSLSYRIPRLLLTSVEKEVKVELPAAQKRAVTCLRAIWPLTMLTLPHPGAGIHRSTEMLRFERQTLDHIALLGAQLPGISQFTSSASAIVARTLLDVHLFHALRLEFDLNEFVRTRKRPEDNARQSTNFGFAHRESEHLSGKLSARLADMGSCLQLKDALASSDVYSTMDMTRANLDELLRLIVSSDYSRLVETLVINMRGYIHQYRQHVEQAGFDLLIDYMHSVATSQPGIPHEASNTLRRLWLHINQTDRMAQVFTIESQAMLVSRTMNEVFDSRVHLPGSVMNILRDILTRGVITESALAQKARAMVQRYISVSSLDKAAETAWTKAVETLDRRTDGLNREKDMLDIYYLHIHARYN
ncbi:hypothetical protein CYLTODRAFT_491869 [Cylindrobasidium torrendii FP15055 ss-10]|uniref:DUF6535 domain-containing protein n=1 Tax=Cylindrobasidium torrendii FP15055 ss-10 TaxID=1314674 RepID=A0A0D7B8X9_9AGAR|nr:hypothetical protein CYLTODRAFT_491869 [Cylindrobasidium torrendii FP15055 ss-10]